MRNADEVLNEITHWAEKNEDVRVVVLTGSRADPNAPADVFSDYDIEITVTNPEKFLNNEEWLSFFGEPIAIIEVNDDFTLRMVLYKDYVRIDFRIYSIADFEQCNLQAELPKHLNNGYKILLDKDSLTSNLKPPAYNSYVTTRPSEEEFLNVVTDFWWDTTYVAKSLWRNELIYAKYMLDNIMRFSYLEKIIEWFIGTKYHWQISTNKHGRLFKKYLDDETWRELEKTFSGSKIEENREALFAVVKLFRRLAMSLAEDLNYSYPCKLDEEITAYLNKIKTLNSSAGDII